MTPLSQLRTCLCPTSILEKLGLREIMSHANGHCEQYQLAITRESSIDVVSLGDYFALIWIQISTVLTDMRVSAGAKYYPYHVYGRINKRLPLFESLAPYRTLAPTRTILMHCGSKDYQLPYPNIRL